MPARGFARRPAHGRWRADPDGASSARPPYRKCDSLAVWFVLEPQMSRTHRPSNRINTEKSTVTHSRAPQRLWHLAGAAAFAAVLSTGPSVAASLLPVAPPLDKPDKMFEFAVELKAPQFKDGVVTKVGQIEAKAKREIFVDGIKQKFEHKQKQNWNELGGSRSYLRLRRPRIAASRSP